MRRRSAAGVVFGLLSSLPLGAETNAELEQQVRRTEQAFAKTMADRDHGAFASFLADETVFLSGRGPQRGKATVAAAWKRFYEGTQAPFSWEPETVQVLDSGTLALTTGPVKDPAGKLSGTFTSIWRREADGRWKIIFDKGCPVCTDPPAPSATPSPSPTPR